MASEYLDATYVSMFSDALKDILVITAAGNQGSDPEVANPTPMGIFAERSEIKGQMINVVALYNGEKASYSNPAGIVASRSLSAEGTSIYAPAGFTYSDSIISNNTPWKINNDTSGSYQSNLAYSLSFDGNYRMENSAGELITRTINGQNCYIAYLWNPSTNETYFQISDESYNKISYDDLSVEDQIKFEEMWDESPIDVRDNNQYYVMSGTSMASPVVAGAAAVIEGAWDYLYAKDIADILLVTSNPTYKTDSGGVTHDVNLAAASDISTDCGGGVDNSIAGANRILSCTYGQGSLDLAAAVSSYGNQQFTLASNVDNLEALSKYTMDNTYLSNDIIPISSSNFNDAVFFDYFGRHYKASLENNIINKTKPASNYITNIIAKENDYNAFNINQTDSNFHLSVKKDEVKYAHETAAKFRFYYNNYDIKQNFNFGVSLNNAMQVMDKKETSLNYSFLQNEISDGYLNKFHDIPYQESESVQNTALRFGTQINNYIKADVAIAEFYNPDFHGNGEESSVTTKMEFTLHNKKDNNRLKVAVTNISEEEGNFLGNQSSGAFYLGDKNETYYSKISYITEFKNNISLLLNFINGETKLAGDNYGLLQKFDKIKMQGLSFVLSKKYKDTKAGIIYAEPLSIKSGKAYINYAIGRDEETIYRVSDTIDLADNYQKRNFEFFLHKKLKDNNEALSFNYLFKKHDLSRGQHNHIVGISFKKTF